MQYQLKAKISISLFYVSDLLQDLYKVKDRVSYAYDPQTNILCYSEFAVSQEELQAITVLLSNQKIVSLKIKQWD
jgi:hypothetical protein